MSAPVFPKSFKPIKPVNSEVKMPSSFKPINQETKKKEEFPFEGENDLEREIERHTARSTSRVLETVAGLPGDIQDLIYSFSDEKPIIKLPSSKTLKAKAEKLGQGYLSPKDEKERIGDEFIQDVAAMVIPGSQSAKLSSTIAKSVGIPLAGNAAKQWMKSEGVGEDKASLAKIGLMIGLDVAGRRVAEGGIKKHLGDIFKKRNAAIPKDATTSTAGLESSLNSIKSKLSQGGSATSTTPALKKIDEVLNKIDKGQIPVEELTSFQKNINELISEAGGFSMQTTPAIKKKIVSNLQEVKKSVIDSLEEYGKTNREFGQLNTAANEGYTAFAKSNVISNVLQKFTKKNFSTATKTILGLASEGALIKSAGLKGAAVASGTTAAVGSAYAAGKILYRVWKSPTLRKYYFAILSNAAKGNTVRTLENIQKLDSKLKIDFKLPADKTANTTNNKTS